MLEQLEVITAQVKKFDHQLEELAASDKVVLGPYLGLIPARHQSGEKDPRLGITKAGDATLHDD
jgi:transposase